MRKLLDFGQRCISAVLIVCTALMSMGCFTTNNIYDEQEITVSYTFADSTIISHQNKMGVLFYTVEPIYINPAYGELLITKLETEEQVKYNVLTNREFPYSTYSDAVLYKNSHTFPAVINVNEHKKELVRTEREFSPVRTALAIGLPTLGLLTIILSMVFNPPDTSK